MKRKAKVTFEELIKENKKQLLKDEVMLAIIEERMEKKWMEENLS